MDAGTQWRAGSSGLYGLDYNVLPFLFDIHEIAHAERIDTLHDIRVMEDAALSEMKHR